MQSSSPCDNEAVRFKNGQGLSLKHHLWSQKCENNADAQQGIS